MRWTDLTPDQQCILLNAVEEAYLFSVLNDCAVGKQWQDRLQHVPHLAQIVEDLVRRGWVILDRDSDEPGQPPIDIPADQVHEILSDPANWWSPEGVRPIALAPTEAGLAVYRSTPGPAPGNDQQSKADDSVD